MKRTNYMQMKLMAPDELAGLLVAGGFCPDMGAEVQEVPGQVRCRGPEGVEAGEDIEKICKRCVMQWLHEEVREDA